MVKNAINTGSKPDENHNRAIRTSEMTGIVRETTITGCRNDLKKGE